MSSQKIFLNGKLVDKSEAKVSVFDHGFLYGDGIFEGIRAYNGRVFRFDEHIKRLYESAKAIMLDIPMTPEEMKEAVLETIRANELTDAYIRLVISRGVGDLGLDPKKCDQATVIIIASDITLYPEEFYQNGLAVVTVPTRRNIPEAINPRIKSLNYLNNILAKIEANQAGVLEAIMLNNEGYVAECTGDNIFIIKDGVLVTPPTYIGALKGIKRGVVLEVAPELGLEVREEVFTRHDIFTADECFLTGTAAEVIPVVKVDGREIDNGKPGEYTAKLIKKFRELTQSTGTEIYDN
ncbi:branched-chain amino acid aminotransferase [Orenia metallireducens]|jgi:branched-chain amino acid aminotransferase|uniref:Branched-chain-amino-acid aminotransferase n=1 Tax=Orenia metallireducens TaxID=1413210 RepID=A0A285GG14_9FIRM|nr:branched-chain-amino-acid transaminase [Orenia metallireducens]PRX30396.1 branched-chain amino acid aminotransferase [Orenia metallireducens]SNY22273.1 branched-chain amino acid aminotransferase [Orenia metallireducens]